MLYDYIDSFGIVTFRGRTACIVAGAAIFGAVMFFGIAVKLGTQGGLWLLGKSVHPLHRDEASPAAMSEKKNSLRSNSNSSPSV